MLGRRVERRKRTHRIGGIHQLVPLVVEDADEELEEARVDFAVGCHYCLGLISQYSW